MQDPLKLCCLHGHPNVVRQLENAINGEQFKLMHFNKRQRKRYNSKENRTLENPAMTIVHSTKYS